MNQVFIKIQLVSHTDSLKVIRLSLIGTDDSVIAKLCDIVFNRPLLHVLIDFKTSVLTVSTGRAQLLFKTLSGCEYIVQPAVMLLLCCHIIS